MVRVVSTKSLWLFVIGMVGCLVPEVVESASRGTSRPAVTGKATSRAASRPSSAKATKQKLPGTKALKTESVLRWQLDLKRLRQLGKRWKAAIGPLFPKAHRATAPLFSPALYLRSLRPLVKPWFWERVHGRKLDGLIADSCRFRLWVDAGPLASSLHRIYTHHVPLFQRLWGAPRPHITRAVAAHVPRAYRSLLARVSRARGVLMVGGASFCVGKRIAPKALMRRLLKSQGIYSKHRQALLKGSYQKAGRLFLPVMKHGWFVWLKPDGKRRWRLGFAYIHGGTRAQRQADLNAALRVTPQATKKPFKSRQSPIWSRETGSAEASRLLLGVGIIEMVHALPTATDDQRTQLMDKYFQLVHRLYTTFLPGGGAYHRLWLAWGVHRGKMWFQRRGRYNSIYQLSFRRGLIRQARMFKALPASAALRFAYAGPPFLVRHVGLARDSFRGTERWQRASSTLGKSGARKTSFRLGGPDSWRLQLAIASGEAGFLSWAGLVQWLARGKLLARQSNAMGMGVFGLSFHPTKDAMPAWWWLLEAGSTLQKTLCQKLSQPHLLPRLLYVALRRLAPHSSAWLLVHGLGCRVHVVKSRFLRYPELHYLTKLKLTPRQRKILKFNPKAKIQYQRNQAMTQVPDRAPLLRASGFSALVMVLLARGVLRKGWKKSPKLRRRLSALLGRLKGDEVINVAKRLLTTTITWDAPWLGAKAK